MRKSLSRILLQVALACASAMTVSAAGAPAKRPNIILVFTDDHAWQTVSAYSNRLMQTPNIDRLAHEGMMFNNCLVPNPICGPSRACVLTGKYSHANGFYRNGNTFDGTQWSFPKALQAAGYQTALIGKWHLGENMAPQGFDYSCVLVGQGPYYNPKMLTDKDGDGTRETIELTGYTTDLVTDMALDWIDKRDSAKPFLLMLQHKAPHRPWLPAARHLHKFDDVTVPEPGTLFETYDGMPRAARLSDMTIAYTMNTRDLKLIPMTELNDEQRAPWDAYYKPIIEQFQAAHLKGPELTHWRYQRYMKDYMRCVTAVDENVGRLLDHLDDQKLADNTIVVYASDQGMFLGEHGWFDKRWIYEESLKTPFLVRWPGHTPPGSINKDLVSVIDVAPTFCEAAGAAIPADLHGRSLVPVLEGKTPEDWRKYFYFHYYEYPGWHAVRKHYGVVDGRYKLAHFYEMDMDEWLLVDLVEDPLEQRNFYNDPRYAEVQARLYKALGDLRTELKVTPEDPPESYVVGDPYK